MMPPPIEQESLSFIGIIIAVAIGTGLVLLIVKFRKRRLWKFWFFASIILTLIMAFSPFVIKILRFFWNIPDNLAVNYAFLITIAIATLLAYFKAFKQNPYVHNFTELFIYGGLASLLVPILNIISSVILLVIISAYDMYAVWHSKHMIKMAEFQTQSKVFAGLMFSYKKEDKIALEADGPKAPKPPKTIKTTAKANMKKKQNKIVETNETPRNAILGGGDIAFPLLFSGAIMKFTGNLVLPIIISIFAAISLFGIYYFGKKNRYYPAMPFLTLGCFVGFAVGWLII